MKRVILPLLIAMTISPAHAQFGFETPAQNKPKPAPAQNEGAVSALVGASQQAAIYRVRSMAGGQQFRPEIKCQNGGDVNIGTNSSQPTNVGNLTVVSGSACPAYMRQRQ